MRERERERERKREKEILHMSLLPLNIYGLVETFFFLNAFIRYAKEYDINIINYSKTNNLDFRPGPTHTRLYSKGGRLEARTRHCTIF